MAGRWPRGASMRRVIIASRWRSPSPGFGPRAVWRSPIRSASRCPSRASSSSSRDLALRWVPPDGTDRRRDRRAGRRRKEHREPGAGAAAGVGLCRYGSHVPCGGCARCGVWHRARRRRGARAIRGGTVVRAARWRGRPRRRRAGRLGGGPAGRAPGGGGARGPPAPPAGGAGGPGAWALGAAGGVVMEGRDIGTVVFPDAPVKLYLTAAPVERARRRATELRTRGEEVDEAVLADDLTARDRRDSGRANSPLRPAADAQI